MACFFVFVLACGLLVAACMYDLVPQPGIEPRPSALGAQSLTHWTTREVPKVAFLKGKPDQFTHLCKALQCLPNFSTATKPYTIWPFCLSNFISCFLTHYAQSWSHIRFICISGLLHMLLPHAVWNTAPHSPSLHGGLFLIIEDSAQILPPQRSLSDSPI